MVVRGCCKVNQEVGEEKRGKSHKKKKKSYIESEHKEKETGQHGSQAKGRRKNENKIKKLLKKKTKQARTVQSDDLKEGNQNEIG